MLVFVRQCNILFKHTIWIFFFFQLQQTRNSLIEARANSDRLTRESEAVVENVNTWVQEQRFADVYHKEISEKVPL